MLGVAYAAVSYLGFLLVFSYLALFSSGAVVPKHVDSGAFTSVPAALFVNLALLLLFGLQHSVMARASFKRALTRVVPPALERATYVLLSDLTLAFLMWQWRPLRAEVWNVESFAARTALWTLCAVGWVGVPVSSFFIDHFDLVGLKQAFARFRHRSLRQKGFVTPLLYKYIRHPMMSFLLVGLWVTPHMTLGHLVLALGMSAYVLVGVEFEERSLTRAFGAEYRRYQATTPRFVPVGGPLGARSTDVEPAAVDSQRTAESSGRG